MVVNYHGIKVQMIQYALGSNFINATAVICFYGSSCSIEIAIDDLNGAPKPHLLDLPYPSIYSRYPYQHKGFADSEMSGSRPWHSLEPAPLPQESNH